MKPTVLWAVAIAAAAAAAVPARPASAAMSDWIEQGKARIRLIAAGVGPDGTLSAGIEIELAPGWKTYWRSPGDSGIAPMIDFSGSANLGPVTVAFPVPHRADDGYAVTNVYEDSVLLPVSAPVLDPKKPVELALDLDIGICEKVCVPDHFEASLSVASMTDDPDAAAILDAARASLPGAPEPGRFAVTGVVRDGGSERRPTFNLSAVVPDAPAAEVFVEGPPDWFADVPSLVAGGKDGATYRFSFDRLGSKTAIPGAKLRVTILSAGRAIEQWVSLD
jgi:DsbC/DsbD-like thiol-disulfide interchange protein